MTDSPKLIHGRSQELSDALKAAGIIHPGDRVRRVIIDINVTGPVTVYAERYVDTSTHVISTTMICRRLLEPTSGSSRPP